jgi:hypothetical protein
MMKMTDKEADQLSQIYKEMTEAGREKLKEVSDQVLKIWKIVNEGESIDGENPGSPSGLEQKPYY